MTDTPTYEDDSVLAGEYALGLVAGSDLAAVRARLNSDPAFRSLVADWQERLVALTDDITPVTPPKSIQKALERRVSGAAPDRRRWSPGKVFGGALAGALAVAAMVVALAIFVPPQPGVAPLHTAEVVAEDASLRVLASYDAGSEELRLERVAGAAAPGRALELWLIADGAPAPVSLGVLPDTATAVIKLAPQMVAALTGGTLAISDEPPGGSPTGAPTGAVLAVGAVVSL